MNKETQVTKRETGGAVASVNFEADASHGAQNITQEDLALPFLKVLGQLSPEVNKGHAKHVEGAEPGMILNTVTNSCMMAQKASKYCQSFTKDSTLNGKTEVNLKVHLYTYIMQVMIFLKQLGIKPTKIALQMEII